MPKTAGIAIDAWKLPIFERHLRQHGYAFTQQKYVPGVLMLKVQTENVEALGEVIKAANAEAQMTGAPR